MCRSVVHYQGNVNVSRPGAARSPVGYPGDVPYDRRIEEDPIGVVVRCLRIVAAEEQAHAGVDRPTAAEVAPNTGEHVEQSVEEHLALRGGQQVGPCGPGPRSAEADPRLDVEQRDRDQVGVAEPCTARTQRDVGVTDDDARAEPQPVLPAGTGEHTSVPGEAQGVELVVEGGGRPGGEGLALGIEVRREPLGVAHVQRLQRDAPVPSAIGGDRPRFDPRRRCEARPPLGRARLAEAANLHVARAEDAALDLPSDRSAL